MTNDEIKRKLIASQTYSMQQALQVLVKYPGIRHCPLCWAYAITGKLPGQDLDRDDVLDDIASLLETGELPLHKHFGVDHAGKCEHSSHMIK